MSKLASFMTGDNEIPQVDTHWFSESGVIDVFFLLGPSAKDVFQQYAKLTGTTSVPPVSQHTGSLFPIGFVGPSRVEERKNNFQVLTLC